MNKNKKVTSTILVISLLVLMFSFLKYDEFKWARINSPEHKFTTVEEFLKSNRNGNHFHSKTKNKELYYIGFGKTDRLLPLISGPPAYIFDKNGKLIKWYLDSGDSSEFNKEWLENSKPEIINNIKF